MRRAPSGAQPVLGSAQPSPGRRLPRYAVEDAGSALQGGGLFVAEFHVGIDVGHVVVVVQGVQQLHQAGEPED